MRSRCLTIIGALLTPWHAERTVAQEFPAVWITTATSSASYTPVVRSPSLGTLNHAEFNALWQRTAEDEYELYVAAKVPIRQIWFPWPATPVMEGGTFLYPHLLGIDIDQRKFADRPWAWFGEDYPDWRYPGQCFAPLILQHDRSQGWCHMLAAANWPPKPVRVLCCKDRMALRYEAPIAAGTTATFRAIMGPTQNWMTAVDRYREWLDPHVAEDDLAPRYPPHMQLSNGRVCFHLQNYEPADDARNKLERWSNDLGSMFPHFSLWGQQSGWVGPDPRNQYPGTGCCQPTADWHPRYTPWLEAFAEDWVREGGQISFYSGAVGPFADNLEALWWWTVLNRSTIPYIDVFAYRPWPDPLAAAQWTKALGAVPILEGTCDIYPAAFDCSNAFSHRSADGTHTPFPPFGRYLLRDRILYAGLNGDGYYWGPEAGYAAERRAFQYGIKLDVAWPYELNGSLDEGMVEVVRAWERSDFWSREPVYIGEVDTLPPNTRGSLFRGADGRRLLVFDQWDEPRLRRVYAGRKSVTVPAERLWVAVLDR